MELGLAKSEYFVLLRRLSCLVNWRTASSMVPNVKEMWHMECLVTEMGVTYRNMKLPEGMNTEADCCEMDRVRGEETSRQVWSEEPVCMELTGGTHFARGVLASSRGRSAGGCPPADFPADSCRR